MMNQANVTTYVPKVGDKVRLLVGKSLNGNTVEKAVPHIVDGGVDVSGNIGVVREDKSVYRGGSFWAIHASDVEPWVDVPQATENVTALPDESLGGVLREFREVKRKANVGERVKLVQERSRYVVGHVFTVSNADAWKDGTGVRNEHGDAFYHHRYVVLEPTDIVIIDGARYQLAEADRVAQIGEKVLHLENSGDSAASLGDVFIVSGIDKGAIEFIDNDGDLCEFDSHAGYRVLIPLDTAETKSQPAQDGEVYGSLASIERAAILSVDMAKDGVSQAIQQAYELGRRHEREEQRKQSQDHAVRATVAAPIPKSVDELRAEIVEQAKADVEALKARMVSLELNDEGSELFRNFTIRAEFVVNREARTVVALIRYRYVSDDVKARGIAKCAPNEVFNVHVGKAIALRRALGLEIPREYLEMPAPTKAQVGDVVGYTFGSGRFDILHVVDKDTKIGYGDRLCLIDSYAANGGAIIDDSRDGYVYNVEKWRESAKKGAKAA